MEIEGRRYPGVSLDSLGLVSTSPQAIQIRGFTATFFDRDQPNADSRLPVSNGVVLGRSRQDFRPIGFNLNAQTLASFGYGWVAPHASLRTADLISRPALTAVPESTTGANAHRLIVASVKSTKSTDRLSGRKQSFVG